MNKALILFTCALLVLSSANAKDVWRIPTRENTLVMSLEQGDVVIELAPQFAPKHVANIKLLVTRGYFDGSAVLRSQDNYVVQWGDPKGETSDAKSLGDATLKLNTEFFRNNKEVNFSRIESRDAYADQVGFVDGFATASDGKKTWLTHCYGAVGVSRGMQENSGNGSGLYIVTGHSPRHLDLNVTLVGRVLVGMEFLSSLPRGTGSLGFYETPEEYVSIKTIDFPNKEKPLGLSVMRTDSDAFIEHVKKRTNRTEDWFLEPTGKIELCNVGVPIKVGT